MIGIWIIRRLIYVFRSNATPFQIASGFILGMVLGLISFKSLFSVPVILLIILLSVNSHIFPYTRFNNTIVMGSLVVLIVLIVPVYIAMKKRATNGRLEKKERHFLLLRKKSLIYSNLLYNL